MTLEESLRTWRKREGFSQAQAAAELGRSLRTYQEYEQGRSEPRGNARKALLAKVRTLAQKKRKS